MVVMRDGIYTPEFRQWAHEQCSDEDLASTEAELQKMLQNGGGLEFAEFFPQMLKELEGQ
jgi:hypothetical protein